MSDLIVSMSQIFLSMPASQPFRFFRYKNIELGSWNVSMSSNVKKTIWAVVSGEILNREALRTELVNFGFHFQGEEDAELAILAYEAWGPEKLFAKINGPFAIALFDERSEELFLGLDRMGQKALYWSFQGEHFIFSTELKGLLASGIVPQNVSNAAFSSYLYFGFMPQDFSAIEGVSKLLPGNYIKVDLKRQISISQYWSLSGQLQEQKDCSLDEATTKLGSLLEKSLQTTLSNTEKISTHLHDSLGSNTLTWMLAHAKLRDNIDTYTPIFDERASPLLQHAESFAKDLSIRHHSKRISVDAALDELPRIIWHLDEPVADPAILQTWQLGRFLQGKPSRLVLDVGWQELMAGSPDYFADAEKDFPFSPPSAYTIAQLTPFLRDKLILPFLFAFRPRYAFRVLRNIEINRTQIAYLMHTALFKGETRKKASPFLYRYFDPEVFTQRFHRLTHTSGGAFASLYYDLKTALPNHHLIQLDRLLSPFGTQVFAPFLDNDVVDFSAALPDEVKFAEKVPGAVLHSLWGRLTMKEEVKPSPPLMAPSWSNHPRLRAIFLSLTKSRVVEEGLISARWIAEQCAPKDLTDIAFRELWAILVLEVWFRLFINRPVGMQDPEVKTETLLEI
ncbi:MAG: hypothetical protein H7A36_05585 [Chlamydiales bacterium]|nr:hypothetical protein [Chlamydiales bacterium]